ncbi:UNVERIFIED_CONTAM: hypothetical protein K2H54_058517 [Gekko kuhli]
MIAVNEKRLNTIDARQKEAEGKLPPTHHPSSLSHLLALPKCQLPPSLHLNTWMEEWCWAVLEMPGPLRSMTAAAGLVREAAIEHR